MSDQSRLLEAARMARARAYTPYSGFAVGAAVLLRDGSIVQGANVENASYGLTLCAERVALSRALQEGYQVGDVVAIAVATEAARPTAPCGACRQWLHELAPDAAVYCAGGPGSGPPLVTTVAALLPHAFGPGDLKP
jgi:homotetrameric cytidine deaminase